MNKLNIVLQYQPSCHGQHVDVEYTLCQGQWKRSDAWHKTATISSIARKEGETDEMFWERANREANILDRELECSQCYR